MGKVALIIVAVVLLVGGCGVLSGVSYVSNVYNDFVAGNENVNSKWSQVENVYQRRADLIPNLF